MIPFSSAVMVPSPLSVMESGRVVVVVVPVSSPEEVSAMTVVFRVPAASPSTKSSVPDSSTPTTQAVHTRPSRQYAGTRIAFAAILFKHGFFKIAFPR